MNQQRTLRTLTYILILVISVLKTIAQEIPDSLKINDGPFIFIEGEKLVSKSLVEGKVTTSKASKKKYPISYDSDKSVFENVDKLAVLSDIHGQYALFIKLFKSNGIVDKNLNWKFGKGHLVITGDIFDRGDMVTEVLWFVYKLEQQAEKAGGKVHYLLGNHEYMALQGDLRYIHDKYVKGAEIMGVSYDELYGVNTVLGRWLRSKSTVIKINDVVYLHGGISKSFMGDKLDLTIANQQYRETIDMKKADIRASDKYSKYYDRNSPIWYRGYFGDELSTIHIDSLLTNLDAKHIVVGHTSQKSVKQLYDGRIYAVDSSMKRGKYGEILVIEGGDFNRYSLDGKPLKF